MYYSLNLYGTEARGLKAGERLLFLYGQDRHWIKVIDPFTMRKYRIKSNVWENILTTNLQRRGFSQVYRKPHHHVVLDAIAKASRQVSPSLRQALTSGAYHEHNHA